MAKKNEELRAKVVAAVMVEMERAGLDRFDKRAVIARFVGQGADRASLYRWIDAELASGRPGQRVARKVKKAAAARAARTPDPAADAAAEVGTRLPVAVSMADITGTPALKVMEELKAAIADVRAVRTYAKTPDGGVRNAKLILQAAEVLRRCLDTAIRIVETMHEVGQVDRLHTLIMQEIERESPECAERIVTRLGQLVSEWGA